MDCRFCGHFSYTYGCTTLTYRRGIGAGLDGIVSARECEFFEEVKC